MKGKITMQQLKSRLLTLIAFGIFIFGGTFGLLGHTVAEAAQPKATQVQINAQSTVAENAKPAVVQVIGYQQSPVYTINYVRRNGRTYVVSTQSGTELQKESTGTGFFITSNGYLLTNKHVVSDTSATYKINYSGNRKFRLEWCTAILITT